MRNVEIAHVGYEEPPRPVFLLRNADVCGVEIQAIYVEAVGS
jgi:hypothetical protein